MDKTSILIASTASAVVVSSAVLIFVFSGRGPKALPTPAVRGGESIRVVESGHDVVRRPFVRPAADASAAVNVICGFDSRSAGSYPMRIAALRSIANRSDLPAEDVDMLLGYIASTNDAMRADRVAGLKNEVLNLLRNQDPVPAELAPLLTGMIGSDDYDATIVDYCIQHLGSMWGDFRNEGERENARKVFVSVASRRDVPYAGTALYALADEDGAPDEYRRKLRRLAVDLACDPGANRLARIAAIQVAGCHGYTEVLPSVRNTLSEPHPDAVLAMVSVGAIGSLGAPSDVPLLERFRGTAGTRLYPAIDKAIGKLMQ